MGWVVVGGWLEGSWHGWVSDGVGSGGVGCWRVHGVGGGGVGGWRVHGVCGGVGGGGVGGWRVNGVGVHTHPPMNSNNVKRFNFMNTPTHQT